MRKPMCSLLCLILCVLLATGCSAPSAMLPALTLPPFSSGPEAPLGDVGLQHEVIVPLHLPSRDGQSLLTYFVPLTLSRDQHPAETILQALLRHEGNTRVAPVGGAAQLTLSGANPVEISGSVCTVNLSASALQLTSQELHTAALAITSTLCELPDIHYVNLLVAGTPVAMDAGGNLPLGTLTSQPGQELPVLWELLASRRTPVGELASATPLTATATLYFPLADGSGIAAEPRRISFPGQHPQQQVIALLEALSNGAELLEGTANMPNIAGLQLFVPEVTDLSSGGRRVTLHLCSDVQSRIAAAGCDPACFFAALTTTLTTFVPSLQQVCILVGDGALTSLYNERLGSMLFPGALLTRQSFSHALMQQVTFYLPHDSLLKPHAVSLPYRQSSSPRVLLLTMASPAIGVLPAGLTDADILGLSVQDGTLLVHFSDRYAAQILASSADQRMMAYSMVSTLCNSLSLQRVRFYFGGSAVDSLGSDLIWNGEFLLTPSLISP